MTSIYALNYIVFGLFSNIQLASSNGSVGQHNGVSGCCRSSTPSSCPRWLAIAGPTSCIAAPYVSRVFVAGLFPIYCYFLGLLWGFEGMNRGSFRLGLALKTPLGRNNVIRLGLFWVVLRFKVVESCSSINQA